MKNTTKSLDELIERISSRKDDADLEALLDDALEALSDCAEAVSIVEEVQTDLGGLSDEIDEILRKVRSR